MKKWVFLISFLFLGCATKTTPVYAVFNTPKIKVSDQGFLKEGFGYKQIVIYKAGVEPFEIVIKHSFICFNKKCIDKQKFIKKFLSKDYPQNILDLILSKRPIKICGKIIKVKSGFIQKNERFYYLVDKSRVLFKDRYKKIVIMIKFLKDK